MTASLLPLLLFLSLFFFLQSPHNALATAGVGEQVSTPNEAAVPADIEVAASAAAEQILAQHGQAEAEQFHVVAPHTERVMSNQFLNLKRQVCVCVCAYVAFCVYLLCMYHMCATTHPDSEQREQSEDHPGH